MRINDRVKIKCLIFRELPSTFDLAAKVNKGDQIGYHYYYITTGEWTSLFHGLGATHPSPSACQVRSCVGRHYSLHFHILAAPQEWFFLYTHLCNARLLSNRTISDNIMILHLLGEVVHSYHFPFAEEFCLPSTSLLLRKFSGQNHSWLWRGTITATTGI